MSNKSLTNAQISLIIARIEKSIIHTQFLYLGTDFWPYIRISLIARLKQQHRPVRKSHKFKYILTQIKCSAVKIIQSLYYCFIIDRASNSNGRIYSTMLIAPYEHRFDKTTSGYFNKHADAIRNSATDGKKIGLIEYSFDFNRKKKRASKSLILNFIPEIMDLKYRFLSVFGRQEKSYDPNWIEAVSNINRVFAKENININIGVKNLLLEVQRVNELAGYCEKILTKFNVKHLINIVYCNYIPIAFILAAKRLSIKTSEYQHGSQDETHPHYTNWSLIGKNGYDLLPENYWVWSKVTLKYMKKWADNTDNHKVRLTGNFYITSFLTMPKNVKRKDKIILLTLQDPSMLPSFMYKVIEDSPKEWSWWIREHPRFPVSQTTWNRFAELSCNKVSNVSNAHLYKLFPNVSVHMTGFSTCAFEAELFGVPTVFFDKHAQLGYESLIAKCKHLVYAENDSQILNNLEVLADTPVIASGFIEAARYSVDELLTD